MYHGILHNLETQTTWIHIFASAWTSWVTLSELLHLLIIMIASASEYLVLLIFYLKTLAPWTKSYNNHREYIKKQRHYFANKGLSSQSYGFSSSHVWIWGLVYKESWVPKNWCFWTVVLEKTLECPLDYKKIQPVNPLGNQPWIFIGRTNAEAETPILCHLMQRTDSLEKTLMVGKIEGRRRRGQQQRIG